jgi:hypothetical protein
VDEKNVAMDSGARIPAMRWMRLGTTDALGQIRRCRGSIPQSS